MTNAEAPHVARRIPRLTLPRRLMLAREDAGLTQGQLAELLEAPRSSISRYESGKMRPTRANVLAWAMVTDTDTDWLLGDDYTTPPAHGRRAVTMRRTAVPVTARRRAGRSTRSHTRGASLSVVGRGTHTVQSLTLARMLVDRPTHLVERTNRAQ